VVQVTDNFFKIPERAEEMEWRTRCGWGNSSCDIRRPVTG